MAAITWSHRNSEMVKLARRSFPNVRRILTAWVPCRAPSIPPSSRFRSIVSPMRLSPSRRQRGATYADFRIERLRNQVIVARDRELQTSVETESVGFSVRVVCKGAWGFAAGIDLTAEAVAAVARRAIEVAESLARLNTEPVTLADEPVYTDTYVSRYEIDPFAVAEDEKINFLLGLNDRALAVEADRPCDLVHACSCASRSTSRR